MPIKDLQRGLREVGRIRSGDQVEPKPGKRAPRKLEHFRFTSDDQGLLAMVAELYGGEVSKWEGAPLGDQWQVYSTAERVPVVIAPGLQVLSQWHELWSGGGCQRRCDGEIEQLTGTPCLCLAEAERQCKPTTRLSVILPEVPGLGVWRLESHGFYAAKELGGQLALVDQVVQAGGVVVASLRLTQREDKRPGQPIKRYTVPALDVGATFAQLVSATTNGTAAPVIDGSASRQLAELVAPPAEAAFARATFPTQDELDASSAQRATKATKKRTPPVGPGRRRGATSEPSPTPPEPPPVDASEFPTEPDLPMSDAQKAAMFALCNDTGLNDRDDRMRLCITIVGRTLTSSAEMTAREAGDVLDALQAVKRGSHDFTLDPDTGHVTGIHPNPNHEHEGG